LCEEVDEPCNLRVPERHDRYVSEPAPLTFESWATLAVPRLRKAAYLMTGDPHRADDIVQDVLIRIYATWSRVSRGGPPDAYAYTAVVNGNRAWGRRRARRELPVEHLPERGQPDPTSDLGSAGEDSVIQILAALDQLGASQRAIVILRYWAGLSVEETARRLGTSEGNVKSQASRGIAHVRAAVTDHHDVTIIQEGHSHG